MGRARRRWWPVLKEPLRWAVCLSAAAVLQGYAYVHCLRQGLAAALADRPDAVRVTLVPPEREPPALPARWLPPSELDRSVAPAPRLTPTERPERPRREEQPITDEEARRLLEEARLADGSVDLTPDAINESLEALARRKMDEGTKDPERALERVDDLTRGISADSAREVADYLGYKGDQYVPKDPPPPGPFDHQDSTLYKLEKATDEAGRDTYRLTLVDREGRTYTFLVPEDEDPREYDQLYKLFQVMERNETLRVVFRRMLAPMASKIDRATREAQRAEAERRRPGPPGRPQLDHKPVQPARPEPHED